VVITVFTPRTQEKSIHITDTLPSSAVYGEFTGISGDFSYEFSLSFSFNIAAAALPSLAESRGIRGQEDLAAYEIRLSGEIEQFLIRRLKVYGEDEKQIEDLLRSGLAASLTGETAAAFPDIENITINIYTFKSPDFGLYHSIKVLYDGYLERQHLILEASVSAAADRHVESQMRYDELAKYGELLTKYPVLLQYLTLEQRGVLEIDGILSNPQR
jgi:hypothetical protein